MPAKPDKNYPEIWIVPAADQALAQEASRAVKQGSARRILPGLYTGNLEDPIELVVRRNFYQVLGSLYPDCVLSHRTAFYGGAVGDGHVYATYKYARNIILAPGIVIHFADGPGPQQDDVRLPHGIRMSSEVRMFLENMQISRPRRGVPAKTVSQKEIEERLIRTRAARGEAWLNELRDAANTLSKTLGWKAEYDRLYKLVGKLLGTQKAKLVSPFARARTDKTPYDAQRIEAFDRLAAYLRANALPRFAETAVARPAMLNSAFFEAYFSNFIEGTKFKVSEAKAFVLDGVPPRTRPADAHDVIGTYQLIIHRKHRTYQAKSGDEFLELLKERNEVLMRQRPDKRPGQFKEEANVVGNVQFVDPGLVRGTLLQGFTRVESIPDAFGRAAYMMFMISEVHPFDDGNGRVARLFMNAELSAAKLARIIIPIVYRDDYMMGMRTITRNQDDAAYIRMLTRSQDFSRRIDFSSYDGANRQLEAANAFEEPNEAKLAMLAEPAVPPAPI